MGKCNNMMTSLYFRKIYKDKGIVPLIDLLSDTRELAVANSAVVLTNMSSDEGLRSEIQNQGVVQALIEPLKSRYFSLLDHLNIRIKCQSKYS